MRRVYPLLLLALLAFLGGMILRLVVTHTPAPITPTGRLEVHFIDVGQGDSFFIRTPGGTTALIDGGPARTNAALPYLQAQGVTRLDLVIATHPHEDHIGGLISVMNTLPIGGVWTNGASITTRTYERFLDTIAARRLPYYEVQTGGMIPLGDLTLHVLSGTAQNPNLNNTSLVLRLQYGQTSFLFMSDAETAVERDLIHTSAALLPATVLKIGHHGSNTSSTPPFIEAVRPAFAIYSADGNNRYGHPHLEVLQRYAALRIPVYGTDRHGSIIVMSSGTALDIHADSGPITQGFGSLAPVGSRGLRFPPTLPYSGAFSGSTTALEDRDCASFATHAEAQVFFTAHGGPTDDPHGLDGDNDGLACENRP